MGGEAGGLNKAAMASTPKEVLNWYLYFCSWIICTSGGMHGWNAANISGIMSMKDFKNSFHWSSYTSAELTNLTGWVTSIIVLGGVIGSLVSAPLNDVLGRKKTLIGSGALYLVGCIIQISTSSNINQVIGARALEGFAGGIGTVTGTMYVSEISPKAVRGLMGGFFSANTLLGIALGYWTNYGCLINVSPNSHWQWRIPLITQMIPGIFLVVFIPFVIESPRWLCMHGKGDKAHQQLAKLRRLPMDHDFVMQEYTDIAASIEADKDKNVSWFGLCRDLKNDTTLRRRFILVLLVQIGFNFSGGNSITYYETSILTTIGITGNSAYLFSSIYGMMKLGAGLFYPLVCAERFGRRKMLLFGGIVDVICTAYVAAYLGAANGQKPAGKAAVAALCIFAVGYGLSWSPVAFGLNGELFPNHLRAKIMSICLTLQYLVNFLLVRYFGNIAAGIGSDGPFILFSVVSAALLLYFFFALPETKGIALEHMDELFAGHSITNGLRSRKVHREANSLELQAQESFKEPIKVSPAVPEHIEGRV
ncbi:putative hexose transport-related protein [Pseudohyphozyma bogoriensis]|nr:putative hexose transport-related protein [Pseudohyphozyma bogoriensis]